MIKIRDEVVALDTETTGLKWWENRMFGFSLSVRDEDYYFDIREQPKAIEWLRDNINTTKAVVNHNIKFDLHFLREAGVQVNPDICDCTMVRACLIDEHLMRYSLGALTGMKEEGIYEDLARMFGGSPTRGAQMKNLHRAPSSLVSGYARADTRAALELWKRQEKEIKKQELGRVAAMERALLPVLVDMEYRGIRVDVDAAYRAVDDLEHLIRTMQKKLNDIAGFSVNPSPSNSLKKLLKPTWDKKNQVWRLVDGTPAPQTGGGTASITANVLRVMTHPAARIVLNLRKMKKTKDTFLLGHVIGHQHNGVVHANNNQSKSDSGRGTGTGRMSMNSPALQQIPKRDKPVKNIVRPIFIPDAGQLWASCDYAQSDFRIMAEYVKNPTLTAAYMNDPDSDFHQMVADMTGLPRSARFAGDPNAKQINLGLINGMGEGRMAMEMGMDFKYTQGRNGKQVPVAGTEAVRVFKKYHDRIPGVRSFLSSAASVAKARGYVVSRLGRRLRFPDKRIVYKAGGFLFQSGTAEVIKMKMIDTWKYLKENGGGRLLLSIHDELNFSVDGDCGDLVNVMQDFSSDSALIKMKIPMRVDMGIGNNWNEAS